MFKIGVHDLLIWFVCEQFGSILYFFSELGCRCDLLLIRIVSKLVNQNIVWNSAMEHPCWFAANTRVVASIVIQNCKRQVFMPLPAIFSTCYFEFVFRNACVRSSFLIVCRCLIVAHLSFIPNLCVLSAMFV